MDRTSPTHLYLFLSPVMCIENCEFTLIPPFTIQLYRVHFYFLPFQMLTPFSDSEQLTLIILNIFIYWIDLGLQTVRPWATSNPQHVLLGPHGIFNLYWLPTFKNEGVSHKNLDFWSLLKNWKVWQHYAWIPTVGWRHRTMAMVDRAQALQFPTIPASPRGTPHSAKSAGLLSSRQWSDVAGSMGLQSYCLHSDPGFTLLSGVVVGKLLNLLAP